MATNTNTFVRCPVDGQFQFTLHYAIWHPCRCGAQLGAGAHDRGTAPVKGHEVWKVSWKSRNRKEWEARFNETIEGMLRDGTVNESYAKKELVHTY